MIKPVLDGREFEFVCCDHIQRDTSAKGATGFIFTEKSQFTAGQSAWIYEPMVQIGEYKLLALCHNCGARFENNILRELLQKAATAFAHDIWNETKTIP